MRPGRTKDISPEMVAHMERHLNGEMVVRDGRMEECNICYAGALWGRLVLSEGKNKVIANQEFDHYMRCLSSLEQAVADRMLGNIPSRTYILGEHLFSLMDSSFVPVGGWVLHPRREIPGGIDPYGDEIELDGSLIHLGDEEQGWVTANLYMISERRDPHGRGVVLWETPTGGLEQPHVPDRLMMYMGAA